jgi:osmotically inducible protein OsmC
MALEIKFVAQAASTGGRNGHATTDDGIVSVDLAIPPVFGAPARPGTTTPEHLFAAGYAACFGSAVEHVAAHKKIKCERIQVDAAVGIGPNGSGGFGLNVGLTVTLPGLSQQEAEALVHAADEICPYSNAVRGNVEVILKVAQ